MQHLPTPIWQQDAAGIWNFVDGDNLVAWLLPNDGEIPGRIVTRIVSPYPDFGFTAVDTNSVESGKELIDQWWEELSEYVYKGWFSYSRTNLFLLTPLGEPKFKLPHRWSDAAKKLHNKRSRKRKAA